MAFATQDLLWKMKSFYLFTKNGASGAPGEAVTLCLSLQLLGYNNSDLCFPGLKANGYPPKTAWEIKFQSILSETNLK